MRDLQEIYPVDIVINLLNNFLAKKIIATARSISETVTCMKCHQ